MSNEGPVIMCMGDPISTYEFSNKFLIELEKKMKDDPNAICNYKMPELSSNAKNDIHFMTDLEYLSDIGRDSKKYNL